MATAVRVKSHTTRGGTRVKAYTQKRDTGIPGFKAPKPKVNRKPVVKAKVKTETPKQRRARMSADPKVKATKARRKAAVNRKVPEEVDTSNWLRDMLQGEAGERMKKAGAADRKEFGVHPRARSVKPRKKKR